MVDFIRKQLNELMGEDRNDDVDNTTINFTAPQHCRFYLCGTKLPQFLHSPALYLLSLPILIVLLLFSRFMSV